jgi:hypothetical protein
MGVQPGAVGWPFRGILDEVQLFNRQLSVNEAAALRNIGLCAPN